MDQTTVRLVLLLLLAASAAGGLLARGGSRFRRLVRGSCLLTIVVCMVGCLGSVQCIVWDGGYQQGEIELTFRDPLGRPVPDVRLRVEDGSGREFFLFPVTDYLPDHVPTSDGEGRMVFHHVSHGIELSGRDCQIFFVYRPEGSQPVFVCRFLLGDREVARFPFPELDRWESPGDRVTVVKRRWQTPVWPASELYATLDEKLRDWPDRVWDFYAVGGTGKLTREAALASRAASGPWAEEAAIAWLWKRERVETEEEFALVKRTVVVRDAAK